MEDQQVEYEEEHRHFWAAILESIEGWPASGVEHTGSGARWRCSYFLKAFRWIEFQFCWAIRR
jgi:hypothetical protein